MYSAIKGILNKTSGGQKAKQKQQLFTNLLFHQPQDSTRPTRPTLSDCLTLSRLINNEGWHERDAVVGDGGFVIACH